MIFKNSIQLIWSDWSPWYAVHKPDILTTKLWWYSIYTIETNNLTVTYCNEKSKLWCRELPKFLDINIKRGPMYLLTELATCFNSPWSCCCDSFSTGVLCVPFLCFSLSSFSIVAQFSPRRPLITFMMSSVPINPSSSKSAK